LDKIITIPFGYLLDWLYQLVGNYGLALIFFAFIVQLVMFPISLMSKKSTMKMSRLQPRIQEIKRKYENDPQKQGEAIRELQKEEGATMGCSGCLWSLLPLLILLPLYQVVRQPIVYMLHETVETAEAIVKIVQDALPDLFTAKNEYYSQLIAAPLLKDFAQAIRDAGISVADRTLQGLNFTFLGINLGDVPDINIFAWKEVNWRQIGCLLIPLLSTGQQYLSMVLSQKMNKSVITNEKGIYDKETADSSQNNQTMKMMTWMMPLMSLWIGLSVPAALSLYWFAGGVVRMLEDLLLTKRLRKVYDAEDAERLKKYLAEEAAEAEKERIRAEKRAANPEGITENTSKKKLQKQQQHAEEEAKAAAKKEYDAKKGIFEEEAPAKEVMSGIPERPYCKGRAYDPNRYSRETTEE